MIALNGVEAQWAPGPTFMISQRLGGGRGLPPIPTLREK